MIVTDALAVFDGSAAAVALTVTTVGLGTLPGARYVPEVLMVPMLPLPPTMSFTFQMTPVLPLFCTDAVNDSGMAVVVAFAACVTA